MRKFLIPVALFFLGSLSSFSQTTDFRQAAGSAISKFEYSEAIVLLDSAIARVGSEAELRDLKLLKARCQKKLMRYEAAAETIADAMQPGVPDVELAGELAECNVASGKLEDAFSLYCILCMQYPDNLYFAIQRASLFYKFGDYESCIEASKAICEKEQIPGVVSILCSCLLKFKDYDGIISTADAFLAGHPDNKTIRQVLGVAYYLKEDQDNAYEVFKQLRNDGDESYGTMYYAGLNALSLNRFTVARECFEKAWQIDSSDVKLASSYAYSMYKDIGPLGIMPAIEMFGKAISLTEPDHMTMYTIYARRAKCQYDITRYKEAIEDYKAAYSFNNSFESYSLAIARCYEAMQDYRNALTWYEKYKATPGLSEDQLTGITYSINRLKSEIHMQSPTY